MVGDMKQIEMDIELIKGVVNQKWLPPFPRGNPQPILLQVPLNQVIVHNSMGNHNLMARLGLYNRGTCLVKVLFRLRCTVQMRCPDGPIHK